MIAAFRGLGFEVVGTESVRATMRNRVDRLKLALLTMSQTKCDVVEALPPFQKLTKGRIVPYPPWGGQTGPLEYQGPLEENEKRKIMVTLDTLRQEKKAEIIRLALIRGCRNVRVFGSVVHGENRPDSDVDFLVDLEPGRSLFDLAGLMADLRDVLGTEVDLATTRSLHPYIRGRVLAEAEPL